MRSSTLLAWILVGTASTTAGAEPKTTEAGGRVSYADNKASPKEDAPRLPTDWVELATPTPASHGSEFVVVGKDAGDFSQLRITAAKGEVSVRKVRVDFADGKSRTFNLGKTIHERGRTKYTVVDLGDPRPIERIVVTTAASRGQYGVYGSSGGDTEGGVVSSR